MPRKQSQSQVTTVTLPSPSGCNLCFIFKGDKLSDVKNMNGISLGGNLEAQSIMYNQCLQNQQQQAQRQLESTTRETRRAGRNNQDQIPSHVYQTPTLLQRRNTGDTIGTFAYNPDFNPQSVDYSNVFNSNSEDMHRLDSNLSFEFNLLSRQGSLESNLLSRQGPLESNLLSRQGSYDLDLDLDVDKLVCYADSMN